MTTKTYIFAAAAAVLVAAMIGGAVWSDRKQARLQREIEAARNSADTARERSVELERAAAEYKQKIDHLEASLSSLGRIASEQDEEIKFLETNTDNARRGAGRARSVERIESTTAELCRRLGELGHPCR